MRDVDYRYRPMEVMAEADVFLKRCREKNIFGGFAQYFVAYGITDQSKVPKGQDPHLIFHAHNVIMTHCVRLQYLANLSRTERRKSIDEPDFGESVESM